MTDSYSMALAFSTAYAVVILLMLLFLIAGLLYRIKCKPKYVYGYCNGLKARKNIRKGNVQFVLWKAGEQGHKEDYWHDFGAGWEKKFIPGETNSKDEDSVPIVPRETFFSNLIILVFLKNGSTKGE